jgi:hypothetical protein
MKLFLEATQDVTRVEGAPARIWKGKTESGIDVTAYICLVQVRKDADASQFESELQEVGVRAELVSIDLRMIID